MTRRGLAVLAVLVAALTLLLVPEAEAQGYAGTPAIVSTLWRVDDRASYELVRAFYERLNHAAPFEALRESQLEAMRAFPHPFAWAAVGLTGLPR